MRSGWKILACFVLPACASFDSPRNFSDFTRTGYQAERQSMSERTELADRTTAGFQNIGRCNDMDLAVAPTPASLITASVPSDPAYLSPGDLIRLDIVRGDGFAGDYVVDADGYTRLPHLGDIPAAGFPPAALENTVSRLLVEGDYYKASFVQVSVSVLQWAPINVQVSGAVFSSGDVVLNQRKGSDDSAERIDAAGDFAVERSLSAALRGGAGVRPDADIRNVVLIRKGRRRVFDMSGVLSGEAIEDPLLVAGDRIHVPSRGCFQMALARPSRITLPGIRVYMSNLTRPAASNANSAIGRDATSLPYGTRFLQGLVSANCVGGIQVTNAGRWGVLISRNPVTGESEVIARSVEGLVRRADRDDFNPVLLPGDAIACYDSHVTNARDVISALSEAVSPMVSTLALGGFFK